MTSARRTPRPAGLTLLSAPTVLLGRGRHADEARPDLVEAAAAIDRSIVPWGEWDHRLAAARRADRGVVFAGPAHGPGTLRGGSARWAALGIVHEPLAGEEGLFPRREDERLTAIPAGERTVLEHPLRILLMALRREALGRAGLGGHGHAALRTRIRRGCVSATTPGLCARRYAWRQ